MVLVSKTYLSLNTRERKNQIPVIGFGTYTITDKEIMFKALDVALASGYRLIDTAAVYRNETDIREALKVLLPKYHLKREDLFITSKLAPKDHGDEKQVTAAVQQSLENLGTDYLDLYLIHWPGAGRIDVKNPENSVLRNSTWKTLIKLHDNGSGVLKNIGVSNFTVKHLKEILADPTNIVPAVNQVEFHPYYQQSPEFHELCKNAKIVLQAYSSMGGYTGNKSLLHDKIIVDVARKRSISPAQVLLRWAVQRNYAIIPKSTNSERIKINIDIDTELTNEDMDEINNIKFVDKFAWNPEAVA